MALREGLHLTLLGPLGCPFSYLASVAVERHARLAETALVATAAQWASQSQSERVQASPLLLEQELW